MCVRICVYRWHLCTQILTDMIYFLCYLCAVLLRARMFSVSFCMCTDVLCVMFYVCADVICVNTS